jgi:hypothetical protein
MKRILILIPVFMILTLFGQEVLAQDYKYHPIFIYNFSKYIEWPASQGSEEFIITVVGEAEAYHQMLAILEKKGNINNQKLLVKQSNTVDMVEKSNIVFITKTVSITSQQIESFNKQGTLLITEHENMAASGSHINFVITDESKIGFELNSTSAKSSGLKVSSALASLASKTY